MGRFIVEYPHLAREFVRTVAGDDFLDDYTSGSGVKCVWLCPEYSHTYEKSIRHRAYGANCPYCSGKKVLAGFNDVATTHPQIVDEWAETVYKPTELSAGSNKIISWECVNGHMRKMSVKDKIKGAQCVQCLRKDTKKQGIKIMKETTQQTKTMKEHMVFFRPSHEDVNKIAELKNWVNVKHNGMFHTPESINLGKKFDYMFPHNNLIVLIHPVFLPHHVGLKQNNYVQAKHEWFTLLGYTVLPVWEDQILLNSEAVKQMITNNVEADKTGPVKVKLWNNNEIKDFHKINNPKVFVEAERHYVSINTETGETVAAISTNVEDVESKEYFIAKIENFTAKGNTEAAVKEMLSYISSLWGNTVEYRVDAPYHQKHVWEANGFEVSRVEQQRWMLNNDTLQREMGHAEGNFGEDLYIMVRNPVLL